MKPIFISFYTLNTPYEKEVQCLIESLKKFNVDYDVQGVDPLGSWQANTTYKAKFIYKMIEKHSPRPLVWMDADSLLLNKPEFFDMIDADVAFYYRNTGGRVPRIPENSELISAAMYFKNNERVRKLLGMWIDENNKDYEDLEQHKLQKVVPAWRNLGGIHSLLPQQYCRIFDADSDKNVIVQNQASRRFRAQVGG